MGNYHYTLLNRMRNRQYKVLVANDDICAAITLKEFKGHVDRGHWEEVIGNEMEQTNAHFSIPQ